MPAVSNSAHRNLTPQQTAKKNFMILFRPRGGSSLKSRQHDLVKIPTPLLGTVHLNWMQGLEKVLRYLYLVHNTVTTNMRNYGGNCHSLNPLGR